VGVEHASSSGLCVNLRRKTARPLSVEQTRGLLQDYLSWNIVINTAESVIEALAIEHRYNISFPGDFVEPCRRFVSPSEPPIHSDVFA
jgi:hypothetical protein